VGNSKWFRGLGFLLTGLSSYLQFDLLPVIHSQNIVFFPQGLVVLLWILGLYLVSI
jgi:hypothetical protein